jgi:hypothetical protein
MGRRLITAIIGTLLLLLLFSCKSTRYVEAQPNDTIIQDRKIELPELNISYEWKLAKAERDTIYFEKEGVKVTVYKWRDSLRSDLHVPKRDTVVKERTVYKYLKPKPPPPCKKNKIRWWHLVIVALSTGAIVKLFGK